MELIWNGLHDAWHLVWQCDPLVMDAAWRSLWISTLSVVLAGIVGIPLGSILARGCVPGSSLMVIAFRAGMGLPTVLIGLIGFALVSRRGPLGGLDLLYTSQAIVMGEFCLALPIVVSWTHAAMASLDPRVGETARTLGASPMRRWWTYLGEQRRNLVLAGLTAFSRCFSELGIAMMIGGNIKYRTRTLATATAVETARGEFSRGLAMGVLLLLVALVMSIAAGLLAYDRSGELR